MDFPGHAYRNRTRRYEDDDASYPGSRVSLPMLLQTANRYLWMHHACLKLFHDYRYRSVKPGVLLTEGPQGVNSAEGWLLVETALCVPKTLSGFIE
jgi:hypothetical protein